MDTSGNSHIVERLLNSRLLQTDWVLYFLLGLVAIGTVVVLWKVAFFVVNTLRARALRTHVAGLVAGSDFGDFVDTVAELPGVEAAVLNDSLRYRGAGAEVVEQQMEVALANRKRSMEVGLTFLGTVGANAPFLGLYGTVGGIVRAFRDLSADTEAGVSAVIAGIAEALVATAIGLVVAIPAVVFYNYLMKQVQKAVANSNSVNQQVLYRLRTTEEG
jgi:biopolymer transport protein ExbB/TolQ